MRFILLIGLLSTVSSHAAVTSISITFNQDYEAPRWMFDSKAKVRGGELIQLMVKAKKAFKEKDRGACLTSLQKAHTLGRSLGPWIYYNQVQCSLLPDKSGKVAAETLASVVAKVEKEPNWMLSGPSSQLLRQAYKNSLIALLQVQVKTNRTAGWKNIDRLKAIEAWLTTDEKAQMYRWAGEMAFIEQNLTAAQEFILRSLNAKESSELRAKLDSIRTSIATRKKDKAVQLVSEKSGPPVEDLGVSDQEKEIYDRMNRAIDSAEYVSAVEDGLSLLEKFPGSMRSQDAADRVLDIYLSIATRTEEKFRHVRERVVKEMERGDADRLYRWANNAFARGNYFDALTLAERSLKKYAGQIDSTKALLLAGRSAYAAGEYSDAEDYFVQLANQHSGTVESGEAIFRLGLLELRREKYSQALAYFERVAALNVGKDFAYRALYWQWRAQQKVKPEKAIELVKVLIQKYPFTYYGLRAQMETSENNLTLPNKPITLKVDLHLLESERLAWERIQVLLKAGWFGEAQSEIENLPEAQSAEEKVLRAKLWAAAFRYDMAATLMGKSYDDNPEFAQADTLKVIYPLEFANAFVREAKGNSIDVNLLRGVARQESSYRTEVKSPAGAIGVMQLLGPTAAELAKDLRIKDFTIPDSMYDPEINIRLGAVYLARLVRNFSGNIPMAVAAYNTGPARFRRWLGARKDLSQGESKLTSSPQNELWIDEMPWEETSFYVKAVLRNMMIYRLMDNTTVKFGDPVWRN